jgi:hexulose-6-phosphate isomerase
MAKRLGFDFIEMSIDETDERLARLAWSKERRLQFVREVLESGISVPSMCLSGHRRYPLGSKDPKVRAEAMLIMERALQLALDLGIRVIQIAGYDEYYAPSDSETDRLFREQFALCEQLAKKYQVMLSFEIMDTPYLSTIDRFVELKREFRSCWTSVYPDVGNLSAWGNDISQQLRLGFDWITAIHLKDTIAVTATTAGVFKEVPFGTGCVDFHQVFSVLRELDYRGPLLIEMWTGKERNPEGAIAQARDFLLSHMHEAGFLQD